MAFRHVLAQASAIIDYVDAGGEASTRRIVPQLLSGDLNGSRLDVTHIDAHCLKAKAGRTFRVDRIRSVCDPDTGEQLALLDWLQRLELGPVQQDEREALQPATEATPAPRPRSPWRWIVAALLIGYAMGRLRLIHILLVATHLQWGRWL